jgi:exopolysaccharide production protein ExoQ
MSVARVRRTSRDGVPASPTDRTRWAQEPSSPLVGRFAVGVLVLSTGAFFAVLDPAADGTSNPAVLLLWFAAYALAGAGLLDGVLRRRLLVSVPLPLVAFIVLAAASVLWSVAPAVSARRSVALAGTVVVGLLLAQRLRPVDLLDAVRRAMLIVAVASLLLWLVGDPRAIDPVHDSLRGVLATKNTLGRVMGLGLLAAVTTGFLDRTRVRRCVLSAVPMVAALALTDSAGGTIIAGAVLALMVAALLWGAAAGRLLLLAGAALILGALTFLLPTATPEDVADLVGRDLTFTGRTDIWEQSLDAAAERPIRGYGYGAFWHEDGPDAAARIRARLYWPVPDAHNGLLDVSLEVGLVGAALAALITLALFGRGIGDLRAGRRQCMVLRLSIGALVVASNLVESSFLEENAFLTVVLVAALAAKEPARTPVRASGDAA